MHNHNEHNHGETSLEEIEIKNWKKRLVGSWIFTIPIVFVMYFGVLF